MMVWKDVLTARVEQGVQLELLDLRMHAPIPQYSALFEVLSKLAVNVLSPEKPLRKGNELDRYGRL
jgi:hypothetical protein